jgi:putative PIN family toxin of toxin-antitoxin system
MRILFDTNILVRAAKPGRGPAREALLLAVTGGHTLVLPELVLDEVRRALKYPRLRARYALRDEEIEAFAAELAKLSVLVNPAGAELSEAVVCRDPDDEAVILSAIAGRAAVLCTLDRDIRDAEVSSFCSRHGVEVLTDVELVHVLRAMETAGE